MIARLIMAGAFALAISGPAVAQQCRVALVLALDVSSSVDEDEYALQANGLAAAFRDPVVIDLIAGAPDMGVSVAVFEWSGIWQQELLADWTWLGSRNDVLAFADRLTPRARGVESWPTALGRATEFAAALHRRNPHDCLRRIIDVSGDGVNNHGVGAEWYRGRGDFEGLTINGLVIRGADPDPVPHYADKVIHGPGAFIEIATDYRDYARAIRRKLLRELALDVAEGPACESC